jgi:hypothetical protein
MIDIVDTESAIDQPFGRGPGSVIDVELLDVLLHYKHPDHGEHDQNAQQNHAEADRAYEIEKSLERGSRYGLDGLAGINNFFSGRHSG